MVLKLGLMYRIERALYAVNINGEKCNMAMALLKPQYKPRMKPLSHDTALYMWQCIIGKQTPTAAMQERLNKIERLYLDKYTAPDSYLRRYHPELSVPEVQERLPYLENREVNSD